MKEEQTQKEEMEKPTSKKENSPQPKQNKASKTMKIETVEPGVVHIRGFLSHEEQQTIAQALMTIGNQESYGFYRTNRDGQRTWNAARTRGRMYQSLDWYNDQMLAAAGGGGSWTLAQFCERALALSVDADPQAVPNRMNPTHLLALYYASKTGIRWHRDNSENDGTQEQPVVSFSLGNASTFRFKHEKGDKANEIRLESGDALVFGGPARMMLHAVTHIFMGTSPLGDILGDARMNLTFREAPEVVGREDEFRYFGPSRNKQPKTNDAERPTENKTP